MQRYTRTDAWSIESKGIKYSIQPWEFESIIVEVLDLHISAENLIETADDAIFDNTHAMSICGKAKFPNLGFVGANEGANSPLEVGEFTIFPIDPEAMENEFQKGAEHLRATLGNYSAEFDACDANSLIGNPSAFGVCRLRNDFLLIYTNRDIFKKIALGLKYKSLSSLTIRLKLYNLYSDGTFLYLKGAYVNEFGDVNKKLFLFEEKPTDASNYVSHGIVESVYETYRIYETETHVSRSHSKQYFFDFEKKLLHNFNYFKSRFEKLLVINIILSSLIAFIVLIKFFI